MGNQEEMLVRKVSEIYEKISSLRCLKPSMEVNMLFTQLVLACIPPSSINVSKLSKGAQEMRSKLIKLCGEAEGMLESHYSSILGSIRKPLDHLALFPYYQNYIKLSLLEYNLLSPHARDSPARVAFIGSGPLPLTSIVLATRHLQGSQFVNYDMDFNANELAEKLVAADEDLATRMAFRTANVLAVTHELRDFDVVFLAALVGVGREEKTRVLSHLARNMAPGAILMLRSAHGARTFLYPVVDPCRDLHGFEVLSVHHPTDEVINSVIVARKQAASTTAMNLVEPGAGPGAMMLPCKCCELQTFGHGSMMEELAMEGQPS